MDLTITTIKPQLTIHTQNANMQVKQPPPDLNLSYDIDRVEIDIEHTKVDIDQSKCFDELGLKSSMSKYKEFIKTGYQKAQKGIARIVKEGDALASIETGQNVLALLAKDVYIDHRDYNVDCAPKSRPKIEFSGSVTVDVRKGYFNIKPQINPAQISADFAEIDIETTPPEIHIEYTGKNVDRYI
ncbi:MAG: DUF6470 family protein [Clostridia bacterium]|nr:DUF6470 family protein [Clostridia bacterium]